MLHPWVLLSCTQLSDALTPLTTNIEQIKNPARQRFIDLFLNRSLNLLKVTARQLHSLFKSVLVVFDRHDRFGEVCHEVSQLLETVVVIAGTLFGGLGFKKLKQVAINRLRSAVKL